MIQMDGLKKALKTDETAKKLRVSTKRALRVNNSESIISEVSEFQIRRVKASKSSDKVLENVQVELSEIRLYNQALRSRIVERKIELNILFMTLDKALRLTKKVINAKYASYFKNLDIKTKTDRDAWICLLYTSPSPRDQRGSRMPSSA